MSRGYRESLAVQLHKVPVPSWLRDEARLTAGTRDGRKAPPAVAVVVEAPPEQMLADPVHREPSLPTEHRASNVTEASSFLETLCDLCMDVPKTEAFVPCGHVFACKQCAQKLVSATGVCPVCSQEVSSTLRVYI